MYFLPTRFAGSVMPNPALHTDAQGASVSCAQVSATRYAPSLASAIRTNYEELLYARISDRRH